VDPLQLDNNMVQGRGFVQRVMNVWVSLKQKLFRQGDPTIRVSTNVLEDGIFSFSYLFPNTVTNEVDIGR
jgi:hypothetical protein